jgi:hypothetical protein
MVTTAEAAAAATSATTATSTGMAPPVTSLDLSGTKGEFERSDAKWRNWVEDASSTTDGT